MSVKYVFFFLHKLTAKDFYRHQTNNENGPTQYTLVWIAKHLNVKHIISAGKRTRKIEKKNTAIRNVEWNINHQLCNTNRWKMSNKKNSKRKRLRNSRRTHKQHKLQQFTNTWHIRLLFIFTRAFFWHSKRERKKNGWTVLVFAYNVMIISHSDFKYRWLRSVFLQYLIDMCILRENQISR